MVTTARTQPPTHTHRYLAAMETTLCVLQPNNDYSNSTMASALGGSEQTVDEHSRMNLLYARHTCWSRTSIRTWPGNKRRMQTEERSTGALRSDDVPTTSASDPCQLLCKSLVQNRPIKKVEMFVLPFHGWPVVTRLSLFTVTTHSCGGGWVFSPALSGTIHAGGLSTRV